MGYKLSDIIINQIITDNYIFYNRDANIHIKDGSYTTDTKEYRTSNLLRRLEFPEQEVIYTINNTDVDYKIYNISDLLYGFSDYKNGFSLEVELDEIDIKELFLLKSPKSIETTYETHNIYYFNKKQLEYILREISFLEDRKQNIILKVGNKCIITNNDDLDIHIKDFNFTTRYINYNRYNNIAKYGNVYAKTNDTNNRLDSNFTTLHKSIRKLAKLDNESLADIDIINSQFAVLGNILKGNVNHLISKYTNYEFKDINHKDIDIFIEASIRGDFYEVVAGLLYGDAFNDSDKFIKDKLRNSTKSICYELLFSKPTSSSRNGNKDFKTFRESFPNLIQVLDDFQVYQNPFEDKGKGALANTLCRIESDIMIKQLFRKLEKNIDILTLHDGVYFKPSSSKIVNDVLLETFKENGFECSLKYSENFDFEKCKEPVYTLKRRKLKELTKKQSKAYKYLKGVNDLDLFMKQSKNAISKILGFCNIQEYNKAIIIFFADNR